MAGHATNWFKVKTGPSKGRSIYIPRSKQELYGGPGKLQAMLDADVSGGTTVALKAISKAPKGAAQSKPQLSSPKPPAAAKQTSKTGAYGYKMMNTPVAAGTMRAYGPLGSLGGEVRKAVKHVAVMARVGSGAGVYDVVDMRDGSIINEGVSTLAQGRFYASVAAGLLDAANETAVKAFWNALKLEGEASATAYKAAGGKPF